MRVTTTLHSYMLLVLVLLCGCASVPMTSEPLDAEGKQFVPTTGKAAIYVYRGSGLGTAILFEVVLDGRLVGSLAPNTYMLLSVSPGQHTLVVKSGENMQQQKLSTEAGKQYFFKVSPDMGWVTARVLLQAVGEEEGRKGVLSTKRAEAMIYE